MAFSLEKTIHFPAGFNESGANFEFLCRIQIITAHDHLKFFAEMESLRTLVDHKHFNHDFSEIKKPRLMLKEVLEFLARQVEIKGQFKIESAILKRGLLENCELVAG